MNPGPIEGYVEGSSPILQVSGRRQLCRATPGLLVLPRGSGRSPNPPLSALGQREALRATAEDSLPWKNGILAQGLVRGQACSSLLLNSVHNPDDGAQRCPVAPLTAVCVRGDFIELLTAEDA